MVWSGNREGSLAFLFFFTFFKKFIQYDTIFNFTKEEIFNELGNSAGSGYTGASLESSRTLVRTEEPLENMAGLL